MEKNKKLRLLVTTKCPNKCPMCCNNQFDVNKIPVVDRWDYDEVSITGGEPLYADKTKMFQLVSLIKNINSVSGRSIKMYLYTAWFIPFDFFMCIDRFDGIVLTPHNQKDIADFISLNECLLLDYKFLHILNEKCSLRLNLFADMKTLLPKDIDLSLWKVKDMEWIENCPVPKGEDFRRIAILF